MRIVRYKSGKKTGYGILENGKIRSLSGSLSKIGDSLNSLKYGKEVYAEEEAVLLSPCLPSKLVCLGVNYRPHAQEMGSSLPAKPLIFLKPPTCVIGHEESIVLPRGWMRVDYEAELAVVIGKKARYVSEEESTGYILGYTCFNDVTERVAQKEDGQWTRGKGYDTFGPLGPWIETELNPANLKLEAYLNGQVCQSAYTSEMVFGIPKMISFISSVMTLWPGDVIATGTPSGIGAMKSGDIVEVRIEGIGTLRNYVVEPD
ncbi:MAG TPA: fumarylacetoacetate hydrolase family protein [Dehalococcoidales bacterium]|nr:fumarylacetoacetate hydrolase family protein [Dehalococcoidales bacterium]